MADPTDSLREKIAAKLAAVMSTVKKADGYFFDLAVSRKFKFLRDLDRVKLPEVYPLMGGEKRAESDDGEDVPNGFVMVTSKAEIRGYVKADDDAEKAGKPLAETLRNRLQKDIEVALDKSGNRLGMESDGVLGVKIIGTDTDEGEIAPYAYLGVILAITYRYRLGQP
jgi:hypothetical protein